MKKKKIEKMEEEENIRVKGLVIKRHGCDGTQKFLLEFITSAIHPKHAEKGDLIKGTSRVFHHPKHISC